MPRSVTLASPRHWVQIPTITRWAALRCTLGTQLHFYYNQYHLIPCVSLYFNGTHCSLGEMKSSLYISKSSTVYYTVKYTIELVPCSCFMTNHITISGQIQRYNQIARCTVRLNIKKWIFVQSVFLYVCRPVQEVNGLWSGTHQSAFNFISSPAKVMFGALALQCGRPSPMEESLIR